MRDQSFHEVQIDHQNAQIDKDRNEFITRGSFEDVEAGMSDYAKQGITAVYLMGTLERDNYPFMSSYSNNVEYRK